MEKPLVKIQGKRKEKEGKNHRKKYPLSCNSGSFTFSDPDSVSDSDSDCKPNGFIVICRIQLFIPSTGMRLGSGSESKYGSGNVNSPLTGLWNIPNGIQPLHLS